MDNQDMTDRYLEEFRKLLGELARIAQEHPDMIDELTKMMGLSASLMVSNRPDVADDFQTAVQDAQAFLKACQSGEIDPESFIYPDEASED